MLVTNPGTSFYKQTLSQDVKPAQVQPGKTPSNSTLQFSETDTVSISSNSKALARKEQEIASRYDVTNLSENERIAMATELLDNKLISPTQHAVMSFPIQEMASHWPGYEGTYDPDEKVNYLQQSIDQLAFAKNGGASAQELQQREATIALLGNLNKHGIQ